MSSAGPPVAVVRTYHMPPAPRKRLGRMRIMWVLFSLLLTMLLVHTWHNHAKLVGEASSAMALILAEHQIMRATHGSGSSGNSSSSSAALTLVKPVVNRTKPVLLYSVGGHYRHQPRCPPGWAHPGVGCDITGRCPVPYEWTRDRGSADAIVFNTLDGMHGFGGTNMRARPNQWLVMFSMESGRYYPSMYEAKQIGFNISADYRLASDVPVTYYTEEELGDLTDKPVPFSEKKKDALVAVFISNCGALNNRGQVLQELIELLPGQVHSYGACHHNKDPEEGLGRDRGSQKMRIMSTYKFAFTPENSIDEGYVTEKVYAPLKVGTIPIYIGAPNVDKFIPTPESIINVKDFNTTADLAAYIKKVANDEKLFMNHTNWKNLPVSKWSEGWHELLRLTRYSAVCRIAMHIAGVPHVWRTKDLQDRVVMSAEELKKRIELPQVEIP